MRVIQVSVYRALFFHYGQMEVLTIMLEKYRSKEKQNLRQATV